MDRWGKMASLGQVSETPGGWVKMPIPGRAPKLLHHCLGAVPWECAFKLDLQGVPEGVSGLRERHQHFTATDMCKAGVLYTDSGGGFVRGPGSRSLEKKAEALPETSLYLQELQRVQEARGVQMVLGIPAEEGSQERGGTRRERREQRHYPETPAPHLPPTAPLEFVASLPAPHCARWRISSRTHTPVCSTPRSSWGALPLNYNEQFPFPLAPRPTASPPSGPELCPASERPA